MNGKVIIQTGQINKDGTGKNTINIQCQAFKYFWYLRSNNSLSTITGNTTGKNTGNITENATGNADKYIENNFYITQIKACVMFSCFSPRHNTVHTN